MPRGIYKHKPHTKEWKNKMRLIMTGRVHTWGDKISKSKTGKKRPNMKGENHFGWKYDKVTYQGIHAWLFREFGRANKCENLECLGKSQKYNWALKKGFKYERKRENFIMLCISCHRKYDFTEEIRKNLSESHKGNKPSEETKRKLSERMKGNKYAIKEKLDVQTIKG